MLFEGDRPNFGDVFVLCGWQHPLFPASERFGFASLSNLGFEQVDDFFGIRNEEDEGDDVLVWLLPLVDGAPVYHHGGPFDGLRLSYNILRNLPEHTTTFLDVIAALSHNQKLTCLPDLPQLESQIRAAVDYWRAQGIEPGSHEAMMLDF